MSEEVKPEKPKSKRAGKKQPTVLEIAFRREKISELMLAGHDEGGVRRIAEFLKRFNIDCSKSTVANDIKFLLNESSKNSKENLEQMRAMAWRQLESLRQAHWLKAQQGDLKSGRFAHDLIIDQIDIYGGKAAQKVELSGDKNNPVHIKHSVDLSNLSTDELLLMEALVSKTSQKKSEEKTDAA